MGYEQVWKKSFSTFFGPIGDPRNPMLARTQCPCGLVTVGPLRGCYTCLAREHAQKSNPTLALALCKPHNSAMPKWENEACRRRENGLQVIPRLERHPFAYSFKFHLPMLCLTTMDYFGGPYGDL